MVDREDPAVDGLLDVRNTMLRQAAGQAWSVDDHGQRHWISDGDTWSCLGGDDALRPDLNDLPGYIVAVYPIGPPATCDRG